MVVGVVGVVGVVRVVGAVGLVGAEAVVWFVQVEEVVHHHLRRFLWGVCGCGRPASQIRYKCVEILKVAGYFLGMFKVKKEINQKKKNRNSYIGHCEGSSALVDSPGEEH